MIRFAKSHTNAGLAAVVLIILIEAVLNGPLHRHFMSHEVDETLQRIENEVFNSPLVVLGDSVGHGIFKKWKHTPHVLAYLACNHATEAAGQYFLLRRYLKHNRPPGSVIVADLQPLQGNLNYKVTENYVQRCFTDWSEIGSLFWTKANPAFTLKMIAYKLLPSFKFRVHLQKKLAGFTNAHIDPRTPLAANDAGRAPKGLFQVLERLKSDRRKEPLAAWYARKLLGFLEDRQIPFYYFPPPSTQAKSGVVNNTLRQMATLKKEFSNLEILDGLADVYPDALFRDDVHLNHAGLARCHAAMEAPLKRIVEKAREIRRQNIFRFNETLLRLADKPSLGALTPVKDLRVDAAAKEYTLYAGGADPHLRVPGVWKTRKHDVIFRIRLDSPQDSVAKIYYRPVPAAGYSETHSLTRKTVRGFNEMYFVVPAAAAVHGIRFDPGEVSGRYVLYSVEAKEL